MILKPTRKRIRQGKDHPEMSPGITPPFCLNVQTNVGQKFLQLIDKCFPKNHPLRQICNRNTLKIGYRCTPNIGAAISAHNSKLLEPKEKNAMKTCNSDKKEDCPVQGKCLESEAIYRATVTEEGGKYTHIQG